MACPSICGCCAPVQSGTCDCCAEQPESLTVTFSNISAAPNGCADTSYLANASGEWYRSLTSDGFTYFKPQTTCYFDTQANTPIQLPCQGLLRAPPKNNGRIVFSQYQFGFCNGELGLNISFIFDSNYVIDHCAGRIPSVTFDGNWGVGGQLGCVGTASMTIDFNYPNPLP